MKSQEANGEENTVVLIEVTMFVGDYNSFKISRCIFLNFFFFFNLFQLSEKIIICS